MILKPCKSCGAGVKINTGQVVVCQNPSCGMPEHRESIKVDPVYNFTKKFNQRSRWNTKKVEE